MLEWIKNIFKKKTNEDIINYLKIQEECYYQISSKASRDAKGRFVKGHNLCWFLERDDKGRFVKQK